MTLSKRALAPLFTCLTLAVPNLVAAQEPSAITWRPEGLETRIAEHEAESVAADSGMKTHEETLRLRLEEVHFPFAVFECRDTWCVLQGNATMMDLEEPWELFDQTLAELFPMRASTSAHDTVSGEFLIMFRSAPDIEVTTPKALGLDN